MTLVLLSFGFVGGCASQSEAYIDYANCKKQETQLWYNQCRLLYQQAGVVWYQESHGPVRRNRDGVPRHSIDQRIEIGLNNCPIRWHYGCGEEPTE